MSKHTPDKDPTWPPAPNYPADAFAGAARYYAQYRVPYPQEMIDDLRMRAGITGRGRLLDLGCGPGRVALPLSPYFSEVWAIDREPEMIEVGREEAGRLGTTNLRWMVGRAEDLMAPPGSFELITAGEAFHRLDQRLIAKQALEWLPPGCCLATMGCYGITKGTEPWQVLVADIKRKWTRDTTKQPDQSCDPVSNREVLLATGFVDVEDYDFLHPYVWTLDTIVGNMYSTSVASKRVLGEKAKAFEADLRRGLLA